jgi:hypothetical protein
VDQTGTSDDSTLRWQSLHRACKSLLSSCPPSALSSLLLHQHFSPTVPLSPSSSPSSSSSITENRFGHSGRLPAPQSTDRGMLSAPPQVECYRVAATARSFLLSLLRDLPAVSPATFPLFHSHSNPILPFSLFM